MKVTEKDTIERLYSYISTNIRDEYDPRYTPPRLPDHLDRDRTNTYIMLWWAEGHSVTFDKFGSPSITVNFHHENGRIMGRAVWPMQSDYNDITDVIGELYDAHLAQLVMEE